MINDAKTPFSQQKTLKIVNLTVQNNVFL